MLVLKNIQNIVLKLFSVKKFKKFVLKKLVLKLPKNIEIIEILHPFFI